MTQPQIRRHHRRAGIVLGMAILWSWGMRESEANILTAVLPHPPCLFNGETNRWICPSGTAVSFTASRDVAFSIDPTVWRVSHLDTGTNYDCNPATPNTIDDCEYSGWQPEFTHTFSTTGTYTVKAIAYSSFPPSSAIITVTVPATPFTVNIVPSAGCTVTAGDGGVDAVEPNGIVCAGGMAATDPRCTEQYQNNAVAALKVTPEEGFVFTGWTVNNADIKTASADTLFLSAMPVLAGDIVPIPTGTADCQATCSKVTITASTTVKRDEIFDVTLTLDPPPLLGTQVKFDLIGQKTQTLPERGEVQMYDFGYDRDFDGDIDPGQTSYTFVPVLDGGEKTIKAVYNLSAMPAQTQTSIKIAAILGNYTFESEPIAVTHQIRKYTTEWSYSHSNEFDENPAKPLDTISYWVDYWDDWNYPDPPVLPYTFKMTATGSIEDKLDYELVKAVCFRESRMDEIDLMQVTDGAMKDLMGIIVPPATQPPKDWDWRTLPDADGDYPQEGQAEFHYTGVSDVTEAESLKWGIRWLYAKKSRAVKGTKNNTYRPVWDDWTKTLENYNGEASKVQYAIDVMALYQFGKNPHPDHGPVVYIWPILSDGTARRK